MKFINKLLRDEAGATAIEYGLIAALIAVAAITAMQSLGNELNTTFNTVSTELGDLEHRLTRRLGQKEGGEETRRPFFCLES